MMVMVVVIMTLTMVMVNDLFIAFLSIKPLSISYLISSQPPGISLKKRTWYH